MIVPSWRPPDPGLFKVNMDAAIDLSRLRVGLGAIIRDSNRNVLASCAQFLSANLSPLMAVALVILRGLRFARESGLWPCVVDSNSQVVVSFLNFAKTPLSDIGILLADILDLVIDSLGCLFNFVPRNANRVAHCLAKIGLSFCANNFWMEEAPPSVALIVAGDRPRQL